MADKKRLIYANELKAELLRLSFSPAIVMSAIERTPTVDAVPVVHGHWIRKGNEMKCSMKKCQFIYYSNRDEFNYCPNCGAKMDGVPNG